MTKRTRVLAYTLQRRVKNGWRCCTLHSRRSNSLPPNKWPAYICAHNPKKLAENDQLFAADLTNKEAVAKAVAGSETVYLVAGLEYKTSVWQQQWPIIMRHVIDACKQHGARLVFFDNVYMYDPAYLNCLTEATPVRPVSKKGAVRAQIAQMILDEIAAGNLQAMIVRAADFISAKNSVLVEMVANNLAKGKKAMWMGNADKLHAFTYVPDAANATALLAQTQDAWNGVWHLPTAAPLTGRQWVELIANVQHKQPRISVLPKWAMGLLGIFVPVLKEFKEMVYQFEQDYVFDSSKFTQRFGITATPPEQAVKEVMMDGR
ncbi:NAD-dependent epimerase/dehydratase family protein [Pseudocnuella soli]|uniref:NAD-dependent epimerase/dehydratase family protein n=1 Tax=Pseudocnuella soli TaxID=2502779 RepID=UPI0014046BC0|nr:NAD-dependent epimerase/dehydratase family protein [Pseudocnuella soli]